MLGRVAYHQPWLLRAFHNAIFDTSLPLDYSAMQTVWQALLQYVVIHRRLGIPAHTVLRHTLGLCHGMNGARQWRTTLSDPRALAAMSESELLNLSLPNP
jgi:tRNA-dihydrouridine synthase A